jgi:hypothetical protein
MLWPVLVFLGLPESLGRGDAQINLGGWSKNPFILPLFSFPWNQGTFTTQSLRRTDGDQHVGQTLGMNAVHCGFTSLYSVMIVMAVGRYVKHVVNE